MSYPAPSHPAPAPAATTGDAPVPGAPAGPPDAGSWPQWVACPQCRELTYEKRFERVLRVCPGCGWHARLSAPERISQLLDPGSARPLPVPATAEDPLGFADATPYAQRLEEARARTGIGEAVVCVRGTLDGHPLVAAVMDFRFLGGSLGCAAGELIAGAARAALAGRVPLLLVTASGGARMQEGVLSLMQMAKTTQALAALDRAGILTVTLVTDPTFGGVAASFATQADVILAEPRAHVGFAGPRVIEQTIRQRLPEGFQTAEYLQGRGMIDGVHPRATVRAVLAGLLAAAAPAGRGQPEPGSRPAPEVISRPDDLPERDPWRIVGLARQLGRPTTLDYAGLILEGFRELYGDRTASDCPAIVGGLGRLDGQPVVLIGHQKGHSLRELTARNFGMPSPAGYRKAIRLMRLAAKLSVPVVSLIDTPGAYPGIEAERDGQAWVIADSLRVMAGLPVPVVAVITGEGGSGGALALGVADRVLIMENSVYSVISPEGCAAILWKDAGEARQAARALRIDPRELLRRGVVDGVIQEPPGGAHTDPVTAARWLRAGVLGALGELRGTGPERLVSQRSDRFRGFGAPLAGGLAKGEQA